jgi:lipopolysaccharide/colanic/teichoic acid biosynthesis glycosyltransferase
LAGQKMSKSWKIEIIILACIDTIALIAAFYLACWLRLESGLLSHSAGIDVLQYQQAFLLSLPLFLIIFYGCHLYDLQEIFYGTAEYVQVIKGMTFATLGLIVVSFVVHSQPLSRSCLLLFWIFGLISVGLARFTIRRIIRPLFRSGIRTERTLIVGASEEAKIIAQTLKETGPLEIVGFLDDFSPVGEKVSGEMMVKGSPEDYERIAREENVSKLILVPGAVSWETYRQITFAATKWNGLDVLVAPGLSGLLSGNLRVSYIGYVPMLRFQPGYTSGLDKILKNFIDLSIGSIVFLFSLPLILAISMILMIQKGRPIFGKHEVLGLNGRSFYTYRFPTGVGIRNQRAFYTAPELDPPVWGGDQLSLQRFLFATGLDKLPQLINVLRGQMSLVGPRAVYFSEVQDYGIWLRNFVGVKPGMTGPWALGDYDLQQEIASTLSYISSWTPWKDIQILLLTLFYVLQKRLTVRSGEPPRGGKK